jgi:TatA/E family protein of Tat protein translocase
VPFLSPAKLLVILVVALVVLGPEKLPKVAKQVGQAWGDLRRLREKLESEVRGSFPDLPSTETITQAVRSPLSLLDSLADTHGDGSGAAASGTVASSPPEGTGVGPPVTSNRPNGTVEQGETVVSSALPVVGHRIRGLGPVPDDPGMN